MSKQAVKKVEIGFSDSIVDLKAKERKPGAFKVHKIEDRPLEGDLDIEADLPSPLEDFQGKPVKTSLSPMNNLPAEDKDVRVEAKELVKVKFTKFAQLVASRDFTHILEKNLNEDIVMSSNLLTDLAGSMDEKNEKKVPVVFLVGLAIGVVLTYILINK